MAVQILSFIQPTFPFPLSPSPSHQLSPLPSPNPEFANRNPQRNTQNHQSLTRLIIMKHQPGRENQGACWGGEGKGEGGGGKIKKREGEEGNEGNGGKRKGGKAIGVAKRLGGGRKWRLNCNSVILPPKMENGKWKMEKMEGWAGGRREIEKKGCGGVTEDRDWCNICFLICILRYV